MLFTYKNQYTLQEEQALSDFMVSHNQVNATIKILLKNWLRLTFILKVVYLSSRVSQSVMYSF